MEKRRYALPTLPSLHLFGKEEKSSRFRRPCVREHSRGVHVYKNVLSCQCWSNIGKLETLGSPSACFYFFIRITDQHAVKALSSLSLCYQTRSHWIQREQVPPLFVVPLHQKRVSMRDLLCSYIEETACESVFRELEPAVYSRMDGIGKRAPRAHSHRFVPPICGPFLLCWLSFLPGHNHGVLCGGGDKVAGPGGSSLLRKKPVHLLSIQIIFPTWTFDRGEEQVCFAVFAELAPLAFVCFGRVSLSFKQQQTTIAHAKGGSYLTQQHNPSRKMYPGRHV